MNVVRVTSCLCLLSASGIIESATLGDEPPCCKPFDEAAVDWQHDSERMERGLHKAEEFRSKLLAPDENGPIRAVLIGAAINEFRVKWTTPLPNRPTLAKFTVTPQAFERQLRAESELDASEAFASFAGRWYGEWDKLLVDHHWHPIQEESAIPSPQGIQRPRITGLQYAWIGDGFGWNYLVRPTDATGVVVLGFVYHLKPHEPQTVRSDFPLVGYFDGPRRLIWITPTTIYFEEAFAVADEQRYAITGFAYRIEGQQLKSESDGFQAVYTRNADHRPEWKTFPMSLSVLVE